MAKQCGPIFITGLCDNLCFYQMEGKYYVRMKSSLNGKRVKTDPAFAGTMQYAGLLANASKISSVVYRSLPEGTKTKGLYRKFMGKAMRWLKAGHDPEEVMVLLGEEPEPKKVVEKEKKTGIEHVDYRYSFADAMIAGITEDVYDDDTEILLNRHCHAPP